jgi:Mor family transcriptional regulator
MAAVNAPLGLLVDLIGLPMALRLVDNFGGVCVYLPHASRVKAHSPVAQVIGLEATQKLAAAWPMVHLMVPHGAEYLRRQRDSAIRADLAGMSVRDVALKYETTERHVYRIQAREGDEVIDPPREQGSLF